MFAATMRRVPASADEDVTLAELEGQKRTLRSTMRPHANAEAPKNTRRYKSFHNTFHT